MRTNQSSSSSSSSSYGYVVPEVEAQALLTTDLVATSSSSTTAEVATVFAADATPIVHQQQQQQQQYGMDPEAKGSSNFENGSKKQGGVGSSSSYTRFDAPHHDHSSETTASTNEYWGRFNDPAVTVLPTNVRPGSGGGGYEDDDIDIPVATARLDDRKARHAFLRKVYMILTAQILTTFGMCAYMSLNESARAFALGGTGGSLFTFNMIGMFVLIFPLTCYKRVYPTNMILLGLFTLSTSYTIGTLSAMYAQEGAGELVMEAAFITAIVFITLTLYTLQSKWDFSFMGAALGEMLLILILWSIFGMIFGLQTGWVFGLFGSIVFSMFVIYDTYMIAERMDPEDYVIAAIELYLDIINLFLYILRLLDGGRR